MTDYVKSTNFASKDSLASGNPLKIVKGTEIDTEFNNIATAVATKADLASPTFTGTPAAPTATAGTNTTQVATTAFVTTAVAAVPDYLNTTRIDVASASTVDLTTNAPNTRHINITGTTTITGFTVAAGKTYFVRFDNSLTLTNGASLVTQFGRNIITVAGDTCILRATAANTVEILDYSPVTPDKQIQSITASVATSALTVTLNPTRLDFRSATLSSGTINTRYIQSAVSLTVPSGATLGTSNGIESKLTVIALDNAGTIELAIINLSTGTILDEAALLSTTVLDTSSDSADVAYSTTARTNLPFRVVGYVTSTQATAGTWASSPSIISGVSPGVFSAVVGQAALPLTSGTAKAYNWNGFSTNTSLDFTSIPSWVKRITIMLNGISTSGSSAVQVQLGTGSTPTYTTSGYVSYVLFNGGTTSSTTGLVTVGVGAGDTRWGSMVLSTSGSNNWSEVVGNAVGSNGGAGGGGIALAAALTAIRLTTVNGTDTFDAGSINILYE